ncbi:MAG: ketoacyl-ACP synthase III [Acidimicrobiales bacterium]|nr:ketoacyl-ACP synthase III [Acidimicrobiales bacterium]
MTGWGTALPDKVVTNDDLAQYLDTSDEWIRERSGIRERRIGGSTAGLAVEAGAAALENAGLTPDDIDLLVVCTTTPDSQIPATASAVQDRLGLRCGAFDLNAACSGFVYGLVATDGFVKTGANRVLLIGSETLSRFTDWDDRSTAVLFADGAGAVVVEATDAPDRLLGWHLASDGNLTHLLYCEIGDKIHMEGKEVFRQAVRVMVRAAEVALEKAGVAAEDVALVVPHQANIRIIESAMKKLAIPDDRAVSVLHRTGNTSSASIPLALVDAIDSGRLHDDDLVLFVGFGAGMTSASALWRWGGSR